MPNEKVGASARKAEGTHPAVPHQVHWFLHSSTPCAVRAVRPLHESLLHLADAVMVILALGMFGALIYAAVLVSGTLMAVGLALGAIGFGGLALVAMLGEVRK